MVPVESIFTEDRESTVVTSFYTGPLREPVMEYLIGNDTYNTTFYNISTTKVPTMNGFFRYERRKRDDTSVLEGKVELPPGWYWGELFSFDYEAANPNPLFQCMVTAERRPDSTRKSPFRSSFSRSRKRLSKTLH